MSGYGVPMDKTILQRIHAIAESPLEVFGQVGKVFAAADGSSDPIKTAVALTRILDRIPRDLHSIVLTAMEMCVAVQAKKAALDAALEASTMTGLTSAPKSATAVPVN